MNRTVRLIASLLGCLVCWSGTVGISFLMGEVHGWLDFVGKMLSDQAIAAGWKPLLLLGMVGMALVAVALIMLFAASVGFGGFLIVDGIKNFFVKGKKYGTGAV